MECKLCNNDMFVAKSEFKSDVGTTDVFTELTMVCINPKCENYAGKDLNSPLKSETIRNKVG